MKKSKKKKTQSKMMFDHNPRWTADFALAPSPPLFRPPGRGEPHDPRMRYVQPQFANFPLDNHV